MNGAISVPDATIKQINGPQDALRYVYKKMLVCKLVSFSLFCDKFSLQ